MQFIDNMTSQTAARTALLTALLAATACTKPSGGQGGGDEATPYVTSVIEYCPAPGQFVNQLPEYEAGDTAEDMNRKALEAIGNNNRGMVSLGGFGGYITVGFDHTIENKEGLCDFRVLGNAFSASGSSEYGSSEPGIIYVCRDADGNGLPDDGWYEIAGSSHGSGKEPWLERAAEEGNDIRTVPGYTITYFRPENEPEGASEQYFRWEDSLGESGYRAKNSTNLQPYFPLWSDAQELTFTGTRLPQNGIDLSGEGNNYALYKFAWGYADNASNTDAASAIDISWATDAEGNPAALDGVDFIRIMCAVSQENGWLGECSTEVMGVTDLHLAGETVSSSEIRK